MPDESRVTELAVLTQSVFDAVDRRDFDAALSRFAIDAVWESEVLEASFEGPATIRAFMARWSAAYAAFELQAEDIHDFGAGIVLCVFMNRPRHDLSEPNLRFALIIEWHEGLVRRVVGSEDIAGAHATAERLAGERA
jgi:hypothetical protein